MNELVKQKKKRRKRAHSLKIYIKSDDFNLNLFPIPFWLTRGVLSIAFFFMKISIRHSKDAIRKEELNEIITASKKLIKEIKKYPPFNIVEIQSKEATILIKTK